MERLDKLVAAYSDYSRKDVRRLVKEKRIEVNGALASSFDQKIKDEDCVLMDGEPIVRKRRIVAVLNKPMGFVTSRGPERQDSDGTGTKGLDEDGSIPCRKTR